jgi:hypothetical protein
MSIDLSCRTFRKCPLRTQSRPGEARARRSGASAIEKVSARAGVRGDADAADGAPDAAVVARRAGGSGTRARSVGDDGHHRRRAGAVPERRLAGSAWREASSRGSEGVRPGDGERRAGGEPARRDRDAAEGPSPFRCWVSPGRHPRHGAPTSLAATGSGGETAFRVPLAERVSSAFGWRTIRSTGSAASTEASTSRRPTDAKCRRPRRAGGLCGRTGGLRSDWSRSSTLTA